jgi:hypothetical protein
MSPQEMERHKQNMMLTGSVFSDSWRSSSPSTWYTHVHLSRQVNRIESGWVNDHSRHTGHDGVRWRWLPHDSVTVPWVPRPRMWVPRWLSYRASRQEKALPGPRPLESPHPPSPQVTGDLVDCYTTCESTQRLGSSSEHCFVSWFSSRGTRNSSHRQLTFRSVLHVYQTVFIIHTPSQDDVLIHQTHRTPSSSPRS